MKRWTTPGDPRDLAQDLDGDVPAEIPVLALVDDTDTTSRDLADDLVASGLFEPVGLPRRPGCEGPGPLLRLFWPGCNTMGVGPGPVESPPGRFRPLPPPADPKASRMPLSRCSESSASLCSRFPMTLSPSSSSPFDRFSSLSITAPGRSRRGRPPTPCGRLPCLPQARWPWPPRRGCWRDHSRTSRWGTGTPVGPLRTPS